MKLDADFWDDRYRQNETGWDLGACSPPLKEYIDQLKNKSLKILIPGAGNAYEAEYLFRKGFVNTHIVDVSKEAILSFQKRMPSFPKAQIHHKDFFQLKDAFDLIIEQTFFCALNPKLRSNYVQKMYELLNERGKLVGLLFNIPMNADHPPYGGNKNIYVDLFKTHFEISTLQEAYNSVKPRSGNELFIKLIKL